MRITASDLLNLDDTVPLGAESHDDFVDAWRTWHHLCQAVVEIGKSWGKPRDDDAHTALSYHPDYGDFLVPGEAAGLLGGFRIMPPVVEVVHIKEDDSRGAETAQLEYEGYTIAEVTAWMRAQAERLAGPPRQPGVPAPDLPDHPLARGATLTFPEQMGELYNHYLTTVGLLDSLCEALDGFDQDENDDNDSVDGSVLLWPHHFDLATLVTVATDDDGAAAQTIGLGITPPDGVSDQGYWYVSPWSKVPLGSAFGTPELPIGRWVERDGLPMAVLPVTDVWAIDADNGGEAQVEAIAAFMAAAFNACCEALEAV